MDPAVRIWLITGVCLLLTVLTGLFTACESAAVEMTEARLRRLLGENNKKARVLTSLLESPGRFVSAGVISRAFMLSCISALSTHLYYPMIKSGLAKLFYIDKTDKWVKAEADSLFDGALAGIFDALNEYDFDTFDAKTDSLHLTGSKQWQTLKAAVDRAKKPDVLTVLKTTRSPYSKDGSITLEKYISVLDQTAGYIPEKGAAEAVKPETKDEKK